MNSIAQLSPNISPQNHFAPTRQEMMRPSVSSAQLRVQKSSDFILFTAEGDKVTLSTFSSLDASVTTYNPMGAVEGADNAAEISLSQTFALELSIEGDLNSQELKDLQKALKTIEKLSKDFFRGRTEKAMDRAERISGLSTIASFEAVLHYQKSLSVEQTVPGMAPAFPEPVAQPPALPAPAPATEQALPTAPPAQAQAEPATIPAQGPSQSNAENTPPAAPVSVNSASTQATRRMEMFSLVEKITETLVESNLEPKKMAKPLNRFMNRLFGKLARGDHRKNHMDLQGLKLAKEIQSQVMLNLTKHPEGETTSPRPQEGVAATSSAHELNHV